MKEKLNPDHLAMIIADLQHGELTTCEGFDCKRCALKKRVPASITGDNVVISICDVLYEISMTMEEVEND